MISKNAGVSSFSNITVPYGAGSNNSGPVSDPKDTFQPGQTPEKSPDELKSAQELLFQTKISGVEPGWRHEKNIREQIRTISCIGDDNPQLIAISSGSTGDSRSSIESLNPKDGSSNWNIMIREHAVQKPKLCEDGNLYVPTFLGKTYALDPATGEEKFTFDPGKASTTGSWVTDKGAVITGYGHQGQSCFKSIDAATGNLLWQTETGLPTSPRPFSDGRGNIICGFIDSDFTLASLDEKTGEIKWKAPVHGSVYTPLTTSGDGTVYVQTRDAKFRAIDGDTGKEKWATEPGSTLTAMAAGPDNNLFVTDWDGKLTCYDKDDGTPKWQIDVGKKARNIKFDRKNNLLVASENTLYTVNPENGRVIEKNRIPGITASVVETDNNGACYMGGDVVQSMKPSFEKAKEEASETQDKPSVEFKEEDNFIVIDGIKIPKNS